MRPDATVESDHTYPDRISSTQSHAPVVLAPLASGTTQNDPNRTDRSASQNSDRTCFRRLLRLVEFASTRSINPLNTMHRPPWSPAHHEGPPRASRESVAWTLAKATTKTAGQCTAMSRRARKL